MTTDKWIEWVLAAATPLAAWWLYSGFVTGETSVKGMGTVTRKQDPPFYWMGMFINLIIFVACAWIAVSLILDLVYPV